MGFCLRSYQTPGFAAGTVNEPIELQSDDEVGGGNDDEGGGGEEYDNEGKVDRREEHDFDNATSSFRHESTEDNF